MKLIVHPAFSGEEKALVNVLENFDTKGELLAKGSRNTIKVFPDFPIVLNVKAFKTPNAVNRIVYRYLRDSKAKRSYEYALRLLGKGIGTPKPVAYAEYGKGIGLGKSFYVCEHICADYTYRDLVEREDLPGKEEMLRAFTRFCFELHEAGVEFKDHSPGNTLIKVKNRDFSFYLVDLNRMNFHNKMSFDLRMFNLRRLTPKREMIEVMANEYARYYHEKTEQEIFEKMWNETCRFQEKFHRKQRLKKKLKFWKK